jgi:hypothetical protein
MTDTHTTPPVLEIKWQTIGDALAAGPLPLVSSLRQNLEAGVTLRILDVLPDTHRSFSTWPEFCVWIDPLMVLSDRAILDATQIAGLPSAQHAQALAAWRERLDAAADRFQEAQLQLPPPVLETLAAKHALLQAASRDLGPVIDAIRRGDRQAQPMLLDLLCKLRQSLLLS